MFLSIVKIRLDNIWFGIYIIYIYKYLQTEKLLVRKINKCSLKIKILDFTDSEGLGSVKEERMNILARCITMQLIS